MDKYANELTDWINERIELYVPEFMIDIEKVADAENIDLLQAVFRHLHSKENDIRFWAMFTWGAVWQVIICKDTAVKAALASELQYAHDFALDYYRKPNSVKYNSAHLLYFQVYQPLRNIIVKTGSEEELCEG